MKPTETKNPQDWMQGSRLAAVPDVERAFPLLFVAAVSLVIVGSLGILFYWLMFPANADEARLADRITGVIASAAATIVACLLLLLHEFRKVG